MKPFQDNHRYNRRKNIDFLNQKKAINIVEEKMQSNVLMKQIERLGTQHYGLDLEVQPAGTQGIVFLKGNEALSLQISQNSTMLEIEYYSSYDDFTQGVVTAEIKGLRRMPNTHGIYQIESDQYEALIEWFMQSLRYDIPGKVIGTIQSKISSVIE